MKKHSNFIIPALLILMYSRSFSQGCSDAGFCTMGAMKPNQHFSSRVNMKLKSLDIGQYTGYTKFHDVILTYYADFNFAINSKTGLQAKLPFTFVSGVLANTKGLGDVSLCLTRNLINKEQYQVNLTAGTKLATNNANKKAENGRPLPMYYQTSLGTYDLIVGVSLITRNWLIATGYQQPFHTISNEFKWGAWAGTPQQETVRQYPVSSHLKRGNDIMFRVERNFRFSRFNTYLGLLPIYRITKDEITSPQTGQRVKAGGSQGLACTALYGFGYRFSTKTAVKILFGASVVRRKINPDGLSREFVNNISFEYRF